MWSLKEDIDKLVKTGLETLHFKGFNTNDDLTCNFSIGIPRPLVDCKLGVCTLIFQRGDQKSKVGIFTTKPYAKLDGEFSQDLSGNPQ